MSWQAYVDTSLVGSGHVDKAAIISLAGDSVWATSEGFTIEPEEMKVLADIFADTAGVRDKSFGDGVYLGKERYVLTKIEDDSSALYVRQGQTGAAIHKSTQAILIGHHNKDQQAGNTTQTVGALADYLIGLQY